MNRFIFSFDFCWNVRHVFPFRVGEKAHEKKKRKIERDKGGRNLEREREKEER